MTIDQLDHLTFEGTDAELADILLPEILTVIPVWEKYKKEWLHEWYTQHPINGASKKRQEKAKEYLSTHEHFENRLFPFEGIFVTIAIYDHGEGFFTTGPWLHIRGYETKDSQSSFRITALIK